MDTVNLINKSKPVSASTLAELLIDRSIDAIIAIDTKYNIIAWNKTATTMYGIAKNEALGKSLLKIMPVLENDAEMMNAMQRAFLGGKTFVSSSKQFAYRLHLESHFIPLKDDEGNITGVMNIVHDVAHRIKAEQQLQQLNEELEKRYKQLQTTAEEMASFTYIASNKIKEPIRQVYTSIEHLIHSEAGRLTDSGRAAFRRMQSSINRMDLLLDDILSIAQISILQKPDALVDLNELMKEVKVAMQKNSEKHSQIEVGELGAIPGHKDYLFLLFYNLIDNSIKFNESETPQIKISFEKVSINNESRAPFIDPEYIKVSVTDNGIGFEAHDAGRIFTMFEKLHDKKFKGSGMGLAVAKKIMSAHNGFITAESEAGKGSSFHCFFPAHF